MDEEKAGVGFCLVSDELTHKLSFLWYKAYKDRKQ
jgi:hypothetical protein